MLSQNIRVFSLNSNYVLYILCVYVCHENFFPCAIISLTPLHIIGVGLSDLLPYYLVSGHFDPVVAVQPDLVG